MGGPLPDFTLPQTTVLEIELYGLGTTLCALAYFFGYLKLSFVYILLMLVLSLMYGETRYMFFSAVYDKYISDQASKQTLEREYETTYWLNNIMKKVWFCVNRDFQQLAKETVNENLAQSKPDFITSVRLSKLRLPDPPLVTFMQGYKPPKRADHEIKVDTGILVNFPNATIQVTIIMMRIPFVFSVQELVFEGHSRFEADLLSPPTFVETVRFSFLETPNVDFSFVIFKIFDVMNIPYLNTWITGLIERGMTEFLVSPKMISINVAELMDPAYSGVGMLSDGILLATVKHVENLPRDILGISQNCVRVSYGRQTKRTQFAKNTANPEFNEKMWFHIYDPNNVSLIVSIYNKNTNGEEKEIKKKDFVLYKLGQNDPDDNDNEDDKEVGRDQKNKDGTDDIDLGSKIGSGDPKELLIIIDHIKVYLELRYVVIPVENEDLMVEDDDSYKANESNVASSNIIEPELYINEENLINLNPHNIGKKQDTEYKSLSSADHRKSSIADNFSVHDKQQKALKDLFQEKDQCGLLRLNVIECRGVSYKASSGGVYTTYVELSIDKTVCTQTMEAGSKTPKFNQTIEGVVVNMQGAIVRLRTMVCYQKNKPECAGILEFTLSDMVRDSYNIQNKYYKFNSSDAGEIKLSIVYLPMDLRVGSQTTLAPINAKGVKSLVGKSHVYDCDLLMLTVHEAKWKPVFDESTNEYAKKPPVNKQPSNLKENKKEDSNKSAEVQPANDNKLNPVITFITSPDGVDIGSTSVRKNTVTPSWNEKMSIPIMERDMIIKYRFESDALTTRDFIGEGELNLDELLQADKNRPGFLVFSGWVPFVGETLEGDVRMTLLVIPNDILPDKSSIYTLKEEKNLIMKSLDMIEDKVGAVGVTAIEAGTTAIKGLSAGIISVNKKTTQQLNIPNADELNRLGKHGGFALHLLSLEGLPDKFNISLYARLNEHKIMQIEDIKCQTRGIIAFPPLYYLHGMNTPSGNSSNHTITFSIKKSNLTITKTKDYFSTESFTLEDLFKVDENAKEDSLMKNILTKEISLTFEIENKKETVQIKSNVLLLFVAPKK